jgi:hypothetical protein
MRRIVAGQSYAGEHPTGLLKIGRSAVRHRPWPPPKMTGVRAAERAADPRRTWLRRYDVIPDWMYRRGWILLGGGRIVALAGCKTGGSGY